MHEESLSLSRSSGIHHPSLITFSIRLERAVPIFKTLKVLPLAQSASLLGEKLNHQKLALFLTDLHNCSKDHLMFTQRPNPTISFQSPSTIPNLRSQTSDPREWNRFPPRLTVIHITSLCKSRYF